MTMTNPIFKIVQNADDTYTLKVTYPEKVTSDGRTLKSETYIPIGTAEDVVNLGNVCHEVY
jgi:hypothetical protein